MHLLKVHNRLQLYFLVTFFPFLNSHASSSFLLLSLKVSHLVSNHIYKGRVTQRGIERDLLTAKRRELRLLQRKSDECHQRPRSDPISNFVTSNVKPKHYISHRATHKAIKQNPQNKIPSKSKPKTQIQTKQLKHLHLHKPTVKTKPFIKHYSKPPLLQYRKRPNNAVRGCYSSHNPMLSGKRWLYL